MTNVVEIETALELRDMAGIEAGFTCLVAGRAPLTGVANVRDVFDLLDRVTAALEADNNAMSAELSAAICSGLDAGEDLRVHRSFADGARIVAARNHHWRKAFEERLHAAVEIRASLDLLPAIRNAQPNS